VLTWTYLYLYFNRTALCCARDGWRVSLWSHIQEVWIQQ